MFSPIFKCILKGSEIGYETGYQISGGFQNWYGNIRKRLTLFPGISNLWLTRTIFVAAGEELAGPRSVFNNFSLRPWTSESKNFLPWNLVAYVYCLYAFASDSRHCRDASHYFATLHVYAHAILAIAGFQNQDVNIKTLKMYPISLITSCMVGFWTLWQVRASLGGEKTQLLTEMVWFISTVFIFIRYFPHEPYREMVFAMVCNSSRAVLWSFKEPFWRLECNNATRLHYVAVTRTCSANWPIGRRDTSQ